MLSEVFNLSDNNQELILRGLAAYYGMTVSELDSVLGGDQEKLNQFYYDYTYNHN